MFLTGVHGGRSADKRCLIDQAIRGCANPSLVDQRREGGAGEAELAGSVGRGEPGHA
jgi:hypothetical protein